MQSFKVVLVGDTKTGKSCILSQYIQGKFDRNMPSTIGAAFLTTVNQSQSQNIRFQFWDTAGQEKFRSLAPMYYRSVKIVVLVYDITNRQSFYHLEGWLSEVREKAVDAKIVVVGNKTDLQEQRQVTTIEGRSFSTQNNACYFCEISAKNKTNLNELMDKIAEISITSNKEVEIKPMINTEYKATIKTVMIGDTKVGKTSIVSKITKDTFDQACESTYGVESSIINYRMNTNENVLIHVWDVSGQEKFRSIITTLIRSVDSVVLVYDITNRESFDNLKSYLSDVRENAPKDVVIIVVGNKSDLENERKVSTEEGRSFSIENNVHYFCELSAKNGIKINEHFSEIAKFFVINDEVDENHTTSDNIVYSNKQEIDYNEKNLKFSLTSNNFKGIPFHLYEKNFTFIVNGKRYKTSRIVADILSPHLRKLHYSDNSINEFSIEISNQFEEDYFNDFLNLVNLDEFDIEIDSKRQKLFSEYFFCLGNIDDFLRIQPNYFNGLNTENCMSRLLDFIKFVEKSPTYLNNLLEPLKKILSFIASHIEEIDMDQFNGVNVDIIKMILKNKSLRLKNEDSLLKFVIKMYEQDYQYYELFEYVSFLNVKEKTFKKFISTFQSDDINQIIWKSIVSRIMISDYQSYKEIIDRNFNGLIKFLTKGNYNSNKTIKITSNSNDLINVSSNLVDYENENYFKSNDNDYTTINFDFNDNSIQIHSYSLQSDKSGDFLKNWVIEASNDEKNWIEIDRRSNEVMLTGPDKIGSFLIQPENTEYYRFVRLRQTGNSWSNHKSFGLKRFEFFGKIKSK